MLDIDKLYYIMDYSGHYFRLNDKDDLVIARDMDEDYGGIFAGGGI